MTLLVNWHKEIKKFFIKRRIKRSSSSTDDIIMIIIIYYHEITAVYSSSSISACDLKISISLRNLRLLALGRTSTSSF